MACWYCAGQPISSPCRECGLTQKEADLLATNRLLVKHIATLTWQRDELQRQLTTLTEHIRVDDD